MQMELGLRTTLKTTFEEAIDRTTAALKVEGFGVLTRIDVQDTFKEKLNVEFRQYVILGACNPPLAHRALSANPDVGLLLPCNVTVQEQDGKIAVTAVDPVADAWRAAGRAGDQRCRGRGQGQVGEGDFQPGVIRPSVH